LLQSKVSSDDADRSCCANRDKKEIGVGQFVLFFDRRAWSNGTLTVEAESAEEACRFYRERMLDGLTQKITWDEDDVTVTVIAVEESEPRTT